MDFKETTTATKKPKTKLEPAIKKFPCAVVLLVNLPKRIERECHRTFRRGDIITLTAGFVTHKQTSPLLKVLEEVVAYYFDEGQRAIAYVYEEQVEVYVAQAESVPDAERSGQENSPELAQAEPAQPVVAG